MSRNFHEKEFSFTNDTNISFTILMETFALFIGSNFKILSWFWGLVFNMLPWLWVLSLNPQRHILYMPGPL